MSDNAEKISWLRSLFTQHPALLVSLLYVVASFVGMFYAWAFFAHFSINVFHYAIPSDFLVASLKEPIVWALVLVALLAVIEDNARSRRVQRRGAPRWLRWYGTDRYRLINNFALIFLIAFFMYLFANNRAEDVREGGGDYVRVTLADSDAAFDRVLLGTTGQFVFLYDLEHDAVSIHPFENVQTLSPIRSEKPEAETAEPQAEAPAHAVD
ncbi:MAG: hypothetical protein AAF351_04875 [Pseudomonadota bacterium]